MQGEELNALFLSMLHLFQSGWHLNLTTTIYQSNIGTQTLGCTTRVHSGITTTYNQHALGGVQWGIGLGVGGIHQVHTGKVLV